MAEEDCFRSRQINDWTDVHAYWDASNQPGRLQGVGLGFQGFGHIMGSIRYQQFLGAYERLTD